MYLYVVRDEMPCMKVFGGVLHIDRCTDVKIDIVKHSA